MPMIVLTSGLELPNYSDIVDENTYFDPLWNTL